MTNLHITVADRRATYAQRDGAIVCGNSDYNVLFTFDSEWDGVTTKTARFIWNGQYFDQEFTGTECPVPVIMDADKVEVGVYAGDLKTTTGAELPCKRSILSKGSTPHPESGQHYSNEAVAAAESAKASEAIAVASATTASAAAEVASASEAAARAILGNAERTDARISRNDKRITNLEQGLLPDPFETDDSVAYAKLVPAAALPYAEVEAVGGMTYKTKNLIPHATTKTASGVTFTVENDGTITLNGTALNNNSFVIASYKNKTIFLRSGATYTISCKSGLTESTGYAYISHFVGDTAQKTTQVRNSAISYTPTTDGYASVAIVVNAGAEFVNKKITIQLEEGATATEYEPYFEGLRDSKVTQLVSEGASGTLGTLAIPSTVQALDGYGWGVNADYYNRIEWREGRAYFIKTTERIVFDGTETWSDKLAGTDTDLRAVQQINGLVSGVGICNKYPFGNAGNVGQFDTTSGQWLRFNVYGLATTRDEWKALLAQWHANGDPLIVYYALETPIETDISGLITEDNFLKVEGGGTVTAVNEYEQATPSAITYQLKGATT